MYQIYFVLTCSVSTSNHSPQPNNNNNTCGNIDNSNTNEKPNYIKKDDKTILMEVLSRGENLRRTQII